jgi:hypothetical protein
MDSEREYRSGGRVPLPGWEDPAAARPPAPGAARENGVRQLRRMSAWSAAALIVGTGAATAAFAHGYAHPAQVASPAAAAGTTTGTGGTGGTGAAGQSASGPGVTHSVATTSASGVTTVTTTRTAGGKTVVTHVRRGPVYQDN